MLLEPAFGRLQLASQVAAAHQPVQPGQMAFVLTLEGCTQDLLGLAFSTQLA
ncbi:hypothetical protein D9M71_734150 [compost metagenome]